MFRIIKNIFTAIRAFCVGEIVDGHVNPVHLAIASSGYHIQQSLHVPDQLTIFSPGPPRLQARNTTNFMIIASTCSFSLAYIILLVLFLKLVGLPNALKAGVLMLLVGPVGLTIAMCWLHHGSKEREFREWKLHKE